MEVVQQSEIQEKKQGKLRLATVSDAEELLRIYTSYVLHTSITFEYDPPTIEEFQRRIREFSAAYPYLVSEVDGRIVGYAYAHRQMQRAAYQWNAELSVYIDEQYVGRGIGKSLYTALIEILKLQHVQNVYGGVTSPNEKSERLHLNMGFEKLGSYHKTGYKFDRWLDVVWFEKAIGKHEIEPLPFTPIGELDPAEVSRILRRG